MKNRIKILRKESNITQDELAKKLGIARPTLSNIERGVNIPKGELILKIASYFEKPVEQIFFD
ncbi:helix-turn-helix transcriptional regulator [Clostridium folliculivorans]|uniref:helix-turn-helix transcriptional regulator n=1 Tax=Clostridium folliculivorans TaxID=2886038 RepID=UPI0021C2ABB1|nr:helix-turn-helix transcriptional regulator [Clostridium folliculivorans]GKU30165.1 transcriptional regulator [Clostridium folliculivorans]